MTTPSPPFDDADAATTPPVSASGASDLSRYDLSSSQPPETQRGQRNTLGLGSLLVAAIAAVLGVALQLAQIPIVAAGSYQLIAGISFVSLGLQGLMSVAAVILGLVAFFQRGHSRTAAAAGLGIACTVLLGVIGSCLYPFIASIAYR